MSDEQVGQMLLHLSHAASPLFGIGDKVIQVLWRRQAEVGVKPSEGTPVVPTGGRLDVEDP